jgi:WD40 repeat protein
VPGGRQLRNFSADDEGDVRCLSFSADGQRAALGDDNGSVRVWDVAKRTKLGGNIPAHQAGIGDLALTPDNKYLLTGGLDGEVKVWDLAKRTQPVRTIKAHDQKVLAFAVSADGKRFVTTGGDNLVKLWDVATGRELRRWDLGCPVRGMAFTADGKHVATANTNTTLYLLDLPAAGSKSK